MNEQDFENLKAGLQEVLKIERGEREPAKRYIIESVRETREKHGLSQAEFAKMLGISVRTLQNWEQGHRRPTGPTRILLEVTTRHPELVMEIIKEMSCPA